MSRHVKSVVLMAALAASGVGAAAAVVLACGDTTTDTAKTITGVVIRAETLTTDRGCGRAPGQVYKYAAVVSADNGDPGKPSFDQLVTSNIFDCFADGAFVNLPPSSRTGSTSYKLELYIYDEATYTPNAGAIVSAGTNKAGYGTPTWSTTCYATQVQDVESLAVCDPIQFGLGGIGGDGSATIRLETASFALEEGGSAFCALGDAGAPDAGDGGDDGGDAGDAGPTLAAGFGNVRITPSVGTTAGAATTIACPAPFTMPGVPLQTYQLGVEVFSPDGATVVGRTVCSATARAGLTSLATCLPMQ